MSTNIRVSGQNTISVVKPKSVTNPVGGTVIPGAFYQAKPVTVREMIIRRINKTLCVCLLVTIMVTFISYYIVMIFEAKLNSLASELDKLNTENIELQADLDRYKSFNNVDSKIGEDKLLQKANNVLEITAMNSDEVIPQPKKVNKTAFNWAIGY